MSNYNNQPLATQILISDEQVRAYVNPTRMTILALLAKEKLSVSGVARQLQVHPANLTHHFKLLEKTGLIKLVEKRETGKNLEKYYRATSYHYSVETRGETSNKQVLALEILRDNLNTAIHSLRNQPAEKDVLGVLKTICIDHQDLAKFEKKLIDLAEEFSKSSTKTGIIYSLNASLYPTEAGDSPSQEFIITAE